MIPAIADSQLVPALHLMLAGANVLVALLLLGLHRLYRRPFLLHWGISWLALALFHLGQGLGTAPQLVRALTFAAGYAQVAWLLSGTWLLVRTRELGRSVHVWLIVLPLVAGCASVYGAFELRLVLLCLVAGIAFLAAAAGLARQARREPSFARWLVAGLLLVSALIQLHSFRLQAQDPQGTFRDSIAEAIFPEFAGVIVQLLLLASLLLWFFEEERANLARAGRALDESERHRRHSEHMEAVGRLAGGVAHDFNNLLTAIIGHAELLLSRFPPGHAEREDIQPIARAAARAAELVRQLLTFSRAQPLRPRCFVLDQELAEMRKMLARLIGESIQLELELGAPGAVLRANPAQIELAMINLASNARDAIGGRGTLRVRTSVVEPEAGSPLAPARAVLLEVIDDGCGIPAEAQGKIFEPFYTTKPGKGTGLGLASVYGIVKQSGGEIRVASTPGRGAAFRIWLPVVEAAADSRDELVPASFVQGGSEAILLVEDEVQVRQLAQRLLTRAGYRVVTAASADEARDRLRADPKAFQLLLSDVVMPGSPVREILAEVRADFPDLGVLLVSGYSDSAIDLHGIETGAECFLQKPFTSQALLEAVRIALDGRSKLASSASTE